MHASTLSGYSAAHASASLDLLQAVRLGQIDDVPSIVRSHSLDQILIALEETDHQIVSSLVRSCDGLNVEMMVMPDFVELTRPTPKKRKKH